ncbi:MAG: hypothetical protein ACLFR0_06225 [Alphaproteobacteria bacterium]
MQPIYNQSLLAFMRINEEACMFYESAQRKVHYPRCKTLFSDLKELHQTVAFYLTNHLDSGGQGLSKANYSNLTDFNWSDLKSNIQAQINIDTLNKIEEAEALCLKILMEIISNKEMEEKTIRVLKHTLWVLEENKLYLDKLHDVLDSQYNRKNESETSINAVH